LNIVEVEKLLINSDIEEENLKAQQQNG